MNIYVMVGIAAVFSALLGFAGCEHKRAEAAVKKRDEVQIQLDEAVKANKSNVVTIEKQTKALDEWKKLATMASDTIKEATANAKQSAQDLERLRRENRLLRDTTPECTQVLRTNISAACPGVDLGLRKLTAGCRDENGRNTCTDSEAAATGTN
jgi:hypothetical protein